jgi:dinuclear metal center YbgI/SA1388 family protein
MKLTINILRKENIMNLSEITGYLNELLEVSKIEDSSLNGLQVENGGTINSIVTGVDISLELVNRASDKSLIIVHHGLFWSKPVAITRNFYKIIHMLFTKDCALYASHLPLDFHKELGNNHGFYKLLGWDSYKTEPFGFYKNLPLSSIIEFPEERDIKDVLEETYKILGRDILFWDFGKKKIKKFAFLSGGASSEIHEALGKNIDLYITGESSHNSYWFARDNNMNVVFAGHYNTEKIGVELLGKHLNEKFSLNCNFVDLPTGL